MWPWDDIIYWPHNWLLASYWLLDWWHNAPVVICFLSLFLSASRVSRHLTSLNGQLLTSQTLVHCAKWLSFTRFTCELSGGTNGTKSDQCIFAFRVCVCLVCTMCCALLCTAAPLLPVDHVISLSAWNNSKGVGETLEIAVSNGPGKERTRANEINVSKLRKGKDEKWRW